MTMFKLTDDHLQQRAYVYVRQSTATQLAQNHESRRRQYALGDYARELGFHDVEVIDEDLGVSSSGLAERPGFERLVGAVCAGRVGAVFCAEASRLARNGRDWHHLLELCALTGTLLIDPRGVYDPRDGNDRLMLGLQGAMSEYELTLLRQRSVAAIQSMAARGELQFNLPVGFCWSRDGRIELDPDERVREVLNVVFEKFREIGSARQVKLWFTDEGVTLPATRYGKFGRETIWQRARYGAILKILKNPLYAGAYAWGKTENRTEIVGARARSTRGHFKPRDKWTVLIREHHHGYIDWAEYLRNQRRLGENAFMDPGIGRKSGRGGQALLTGMLRCLRCGRKFQVGYGGPKKGGARYVCRGGFPNDKAQQCISFGGLRVDRAVSAEVLRAVERPALEAAVLARERILDQDSARIRALSLELEQAAYQVELALRRYEAVDPSNRLVARELEKRWEEAMRAEAEVRDRLQVAELEIADREAPSLEMLESLAVDLPILWDDPRTDHKLKQRIVGILIHEILADVDSETSEILLTIHWAGGHHSELRVHKNKPGRNGNAAGPDVEATIAAMVGRFSDEQIAATLNRLGLRTGKGNTWTKGRVSAYRSHRSLPPFDPTARDETALTLADAARELGVSSFSVKKLIVAGTLEASQAIECAPWQISPAALDSIKVREAVARIRERSNAPRSENSDDHNLTIPGT